MANIGKKTAILKYFKHRNQELKDFLKELKDLSPEEELELAQGSARELGYTSEQCEFLPISFRGVK